MRRFSILTFVTLIFLLVMSASVALVQAESPHFLPQTGQPSCTVTLTSTADGTSASVTCTGTLAGLANADLVINVAVSGFALYTCENNGGNQAAGQNKVLVGPDVSSTAIPASGLKNGRLKFTTNPAESDAAATVSGATAGCPNPNWTGVDPVVTVTAVTLTVFQPADTKILTCSQQNPNGLTGNFTFTNCTFP